MPVGPPLAQALEAYAATRAAFPASPAGEATFLANRDGTPLKARTVHKAFDALRHQAGVRNADGARYQPRLHDLRHSFATHRLTSWYRQGADVQRLLPVLATYLGHESVAGTQVYLTLTPELLREASLRFERYAETGTGAAMPDVQTLGPWLRRFFEEYLVSERNLARNTQLSYRDTFKLLLAFAADRLRKPAERLVVRELSPELALAFLAHLEDRRGCSPQTRNQRLTALRAFARFVGGRSPAHVEWCAQIRALPFKKATPQLVAYLEKTEIDALLAAPDGATPQGRRESILLLFLLQHGSPGGRSGQSAGRRSAVEQGRQGGRSL